MEMLALRLSWLISRVLFEVIIHLELMSPWISSGLPRFNAENIIKSLFGLAPSGVYLAVLCYQKTRWALTSPFHPYPKAVYFLMHFPWWPIMSHLQELPGTLSFGARTFLCIAAITRSAQLDYTFSLNLL